ncbi:MAG: hydratase [Lachnospiraceae bacterium]|nr:hydratase [Lachnospiraceae bacterium]
MIRLIDHGVFLTKQGNVIENKDIREKDEGRKKTMAYRILQAHNKSGDRENLKLTFDALVSPDNNYVNILQTVRASGIKRFPVPYVLSNCHHTLCAVGGTINEDDHVFGLGNAKKYGGIFVPPYRAVLHQYMRERMAGGGRMILGSDSHTRYGALGTLGIGEGGGEVAKQLLGHTYDVKYPPVLAVRLTGIPRSGVGPQDVALALVAATFKNNFNKNKILEFVGPGIGNLSMEYRMGIDVMTTESAALSSIWCTDELTREYLREHGREDAYQEMMPEDGAWYEGMIDIDLSQVECMIALPFHPSNAMPIRVFKERMEEILQEVEAEGQKIKGPKGKPFSIMSHVRDGEFYVDQALVSGCSGGLFENIVAMADILKGYGIPGNGLNLGVNPASLPVMADLMKQGIAGELAVSGVTLRPAICGPCFGVTDVPADNQVSIRHMTRNYPNREGSKPGQGQMAAACLMDARSIAATVRNGGKLTAATELSVEYRSLSYHFDPDIYKNQVFDNFGKGDAGEKLVMGPNIADWPKMAPLGKHLLLRVAGSYEGSVTTDELIPSGEASSFRSNPEKISEYTMISRDKDYVGRAKAVRELEKQRQAWARECSFCGSAIEKPEKTGSMVENILAALLRQEQCSVEDILIGSAMVSQQIGDGSSREQAASCQKVLGGFANIANAYATKRYRSNLINWGILPLRTEKELKLPTDTWIFIKNIRQVIEEKRETVELQVLELTETGRVDMAESLECTLDNLTEDERKIMLAGSLINYYKNQ